MILFVIRDVKAEVYKTPMMFENFAEAERQFTTACRQGETMLSQYPEDFILYAIADINVINATVTVFDSPIEVIRGFDIKAKQIENIRKNMEGVKNGNENNE